MTGKMPYALAVCAMIPMGSAAMVQAQTADCACVLTEAQGVLGQLSSVEGSILISGESGFQVAQIGDTLAAGSQVLAGPQSQATASFGGCSVNLSAGARLNVLSQNGGLCVQSTSLTAQNAQAPAGGDTTLQVSTQVGEEVVVGGLLGGGAAGPVIIGGVVIGGAAIASGSSSP